MGRDELQEILMDASKARHLLGPLARKIGDIGVAEQTAIAGALNPDVLGNAEQAQEAADYVAKRLDSLADPLERGWTGEPTENGGVVFKRTLRGVAQIREIDGDLVRSVEGLRLMQWHRHYSAFMAGIRHTPCEGRRNQDFRTRRIDRKSHGIGQEGDRRSTLQRPW